MNNSGKQIMAFLAGAAAGAIVTYLLTSKEGEDIIDEFKNLAGKVKENIAEQMSNIQQNKAQREQRQEQEDMMGV